MNIPIRKLPLSLKNFWPTNNIVETCVCHAVVEEDTGRFRGGEKWLPMFEVGFPQCDWTVSLLLPFLWFGSWGDGRQREREEATEEVKKQRKWNREKLHDKMVIVVTVFLSTLVAACSSQ